ncbi:MAG TPA: hypothetical protein DCL61_10645 [Cyanobacteria bacterium UBA12227]|nr:hypothetical protein [Cyanobacteria bacterium UBA12227]HAX89799.1 hypothetical protein [Cyanobacteria bacterium UBA11370]HBY79386.1 hypothetical protein [Cyanobacteria bacterium UBA11148]
MEFSEFEFSLPKGLVDSEGGVHRYGMMRLATGKDEIVIQKDRIVREDPAYKILVVLSNVITRLGSVSLVTPKLLEELFLIDLIYLQEFFNRINQEDGGVLSMGEL